MTYPNPVPILCEHFGHTLASISIATGHPFKFIDQLHSLHNAKSVPAKLHMKLQRLSMIEWGIATRDKRLVNSDGKPVYPKAARDQLWRLYFPDTRPHIYHLLHYVHGQNLSSAATEVNVGGRTIKQGYSLQVIDKILRQPKLHKRQLDRIRRFAVEYIDAIGSKNRKYGPDPAYMALYRALHDPSRQYAPGEIVVD